MNCPDAKKIPPAAVYTPRSILEKLEWAEVFSKPQPVEVDLGCGDGSFLLQLATHFPQRNFLGVERLKGRAWKAARKIDRAGLTNARVIRLEAGYAVQHLFPAATVAAYHILFPDPWPKRRHHRRRLFTPEFVAALARTLAPGGAVNLATDYEEYFREMQTRFGSGWQPVEPIVWGGEQWKTDFEREFVKEGRTIYRARLLQLD